MSDWLTRIEKSKEWEIETIPNILTVDGNAYSGFTLVFGDLKFIYYHDWSDPDKECPVCMIIHPPDAPHYPATPYFRKFTEKHGRFPHWSDATAHCPPEIREKIREFLDSQGKWSEPVEGLPQEEVVARELGAMPVHSQREDPVAKVYSVFIRTMDDAKKVTNPFIGLPNTEAAREVIKETLQSVFGDDIKVIDPDKSCARDNVIELELMIKPEVTADNIKLYVEE